MSETRAETTGIEPQLVHLTLLDVRSVSRLLRISPRQIWRLVAMAEAGRGTFPKPLRLGTRTVRWRLADVEAYLAGVAQGARP